MKFQQEGPSPFHGTAGRATLAFGSKNILTQIQAREGVWFIQDQRATASQAAQSVEMAADALDLFLKDERLEHGVTGGAARITIRPQTPSASQGDTVITAGRFEMSFGADSRLRALHGEPDARIVGSTPGQPDKVSTSQTLDVAFNPGEGGIASVVQQGNVRYNDAQRSAFANEAHYTPGDENLVLTGSPRWMEAGGATTARVLKLNRRTGDAFAEGEVKTTYRETRPQPGGALLGGSEPVHVTANTHDRQPPDQHRDLLRLGASVAGEQHRGGFGDRIRPRQPPAEGQGCPAAGLDGFRPERRQEQRDAGHRNLLLADLLRPAAPSGFRGGSVA